MKELLQRARALRRNQTEVEQRLWYRLRAQRFQGVKFKRQKPLGPYIVDFVCMEHRLVIELDGGQHADNAGYDRRRDRWLRANGYTVLRFWNDQVTKELPAVLEHIAARLALSAGPSPARGRGGRKGRASP